MKNRGSAHLPRSFAWVGLLGCLYSLAGCSSRPEDTLAEIGRAVTENDILAFEAMVDLDSLAAAIAASPLQHSAAVEALQDGLDRGSLVAAALGTFMGARGVEFRIETLESVSDQVFLELGAVEEQGERALAPMTIAHPFNAAEAIEITAELSKSDAGWRVVGLRGLSGLAEALADPPASPTELVSESLRDLSSEQEIHFAVGDYTYAGSVEEMDFTPTDGVSIEVKATSDGQGWAAAATWDDDPSHSCAVFYGRGARTLGVVTSMGLPPVLPGRIDCDPLGTPVRPYDHLR